VAQLGLDTRIGTAEGALLGRAAHAPHANDPVLDDFWAVELLSPEAHALVRDPEHSRDDCRR
jgi:O-methyltransferase involved in polyketide biosynthesis